MARDEIKFGITEGITLGNIGTMKQIRWQDIVLVAKRVAFEATGKRIDLSSTNVPSIPMDLLIIGKMYTSSDKIAGATRHIADSNELGRVPLRGKKGGFSLPFLKRKEVQLEDPSDVEDSKVIIQRYFGLSTPPDRIVGFIIRPLN